MSLRVLESGPVTRRLTPSEVALIRQFFPAHHDAPPPVRWFTPPQNEPAPLLFKERRLRDQLSQKCQKRSPKGFPCVKPLHAGHCLFLNPNWRSRWRKVNGQWRMRLMPHDAADAGG